MFLLAGMVAYGASPTRTSDLPVDPLRNPERESLELGALSRWSTLTVPFGSRDSNDLTEVEFREAAKSFERYFNAEIENDSDRELVLFASWSTNTVNAYAERDGRKDFITVYGGLARHPAVTRDGLVAVLCHELGHHLGGFPRKRTNEWSSAEGQADYYATSKCLRDYWRLADNRGAIAGMTVPPAVRSDCAASAYEAALCERIAMAGFSVAKLIQALDYDTIEPNFSTPDPARVSYTDVMYPYAQCRLDTLYAGARCSVPYSIPFADDSEVGGACHGAAAEAAGSARPRCWFAPRD